MSQYTHRLLERSGVVKSHRDLDVWWKSLDLVDHIYEMTRSFPRWEDFGLRCQMTRAANSVPANIAEGAGRATAKDFANFLVNARSSLMELDSHLTVAARRSYIDEHTINFVMPLLNEVGKMLNGLRASILRSAPKRQLTTSNEQLTTNN
ncbi:MAG TPA: four helix bundle protein [Dehalococcoidia bacterium]|nr:four helix bundle protein [Dehalococcoidia bacterium]